MLEESMSQDQTEPNEPDEGDGGDEVEGDESEN